MKKNKGVNALRRKVMRALTKNIGRQPLSTQPSSVNRTIRRVLICRPNRRLGNLLLITPLLQEIEAVLPESKIDLLVQGRLAPILFDRYPQIDRILKLPVNALKSPFRYLGTWLAIGKRRYDLVINVAPNSSSGRIATRIARARDKIYGETASQQEPASPERKHMAKLPVYTFRDFLTGAGLPVARGPVPPLALRLGPSEMAAGKKRLGELVADSPRTISLFTFATGDKCYSKAWWELFYDRLKKEFPAYRLIEVLPVQNVSQLSFTIPSFYSRDLREIGAFIANTDLFIGADSGMMHLAHAAGACIVGLFSVTDETVYYPYGRGSLAINTTKSGMDDWIARIREALTRSAADDPSRTSFPGK
jgi:ADP-heptose:LPS heptosyltransferase